MKFVELNEIMLMFTFYDVWLTIFEEVSEI